MYACLHLHRNCNKVLIPRGLYWKRRACQVSPNLSGLWAVGVHQGLTCSSLGYVADLAQHSLVPCSDCGEEGGCWFSMGCIQQWMWSRAGECAALGFPGSRSSNMETHQLQKVLCISFLQPPPPPGLREKLTVRDVRDPSFGKLSLCFCPTSLCSNLGGCMGLKSGAQSTSACLPGHC